MYDMLLPFCNALTLGQCLVLCNHPHILPNVQAILDYDEGCSSVKQSWQVSARKFVKEEVI